MKNKIPYILILLMGLWIIYLYHNKEEENKVVIPEITTDSIIRDSIYIVNDSIIERIKYVDKEYDEKVSIIMSNNDSLNYRTFSEYIDHYNNQRTIKNN